jgi:hypothetical protein
VVAVRACLTVRINVPAVPVVQVPPINNSYILPARGSKAGIGVYAVGIRTVSVVAVIVAKSALTGSLITSPKY